jgi:hypothetical protein
MSRWITVLAVPIIVTLATEAVAQQNEAYIIPEQLQKLAIDAGIAERLGIKWDAPKAKDVSHYMGMLATAAVLAKEIARRNERKTPTDADFLAALASTCTWPPNKPPTIKDEWPTFYPAFFDARLRNALPMALGPQAVTLPMVLKRQEHVLPMNQTFEFPKDKMLYFKDVLDVRKLPKAKDLETK